MKLTRIDYCILQVNLVIKKMNIPLIQLGIEEQESIQYNMIVVVFVNEIYTN